MTSQNHKSIVDVFIEITKGSSVKYEYDEKTGRLVVDRFLHTSMYYPFNYGFVPETLSEDGDPVDVLVLTLEPVLPGAILPTRIIGMLETEDEEGRDIKLIGVPTEKIEADSSKVHNVLDLYSSTKDRIAHFFEYYKSLERGKWVKVKKWSGKDEAVNYLKMASEKFKNSQNGERTEVKL